MQRWHLVAASFLLGSVASVLCRSVERSPRDVSDVAQLASSTRQIGGGLSALGTLVSPLLFLMGMGSFISMLPQMFQTVLSGVGSNLIGAFTGAGSNPASSRLRRQFHDPDTADLIAIREHLSRAIHKYGRPDVL